MSSEITDKMNIKEEKSIFFYERLKIVFKFFLRHQPHQQGYSHVYNGIYTHWSIVPNTANGLYL